MTQKGHCGMMLESNQAVLTNTGNPSTPFPILKWGKVNTGKTVKAVELWLCTNAILEATRCNDAFNLPVFEQELKYVGKLPQASKDAMEAYLFDELWVPIKS